jgi:D-apionate oxidoisomerase
MLVTVRRDWPVMVANPGGKLSDGAIKAVDEAKKTLFQPGWMEAVFSDEAVMRSVKSISKG